MDPPGSHEKSNRKPARSMFGGMRHRSKDESSSTSSRNNRTRSAEVGRSKSQGIATATTSMTPPRTSNSFINYKNQPHQQLASSDEDSYVKVPSLNNKNNNSTQLILPPELVRKQEQILEESRKRLQQEQSVQQNNKQQHQQRQQQSVQNQRQARMPPPPTLEPSFSTSSLTRRKSLHKKAASLATYQMTPITKHYEISRQILAAFDSHWTNHLWVTAYAVGLQFVETALLELPKHGYFYSKRHERERMANTLEAARVAHLLHKLLLDQEEEPAVPDSKGLTEPTAGLVPAGDLERVQKLLQLAMEQVEQAGDDQIRNKNKREEVEEELRASFALMGSQDFTPTTTDWITCGGATAAAVIEPALSACSELCASDAVFIEDDKSAVTSTYSILSLGKEDGESITTRGTSASRSLIRGTLLLPPHPEHVHDGSSSELLLEKALFLSGLEVTEATGVGCEEAGDRRVPPPEASVVGRPQGHKSAAILELSTLSMLYHEDFDSLQQTRRVRISFADTYQGRMAESTNGCTVIAPLLCMHHLISEPTEYHYETGGDPGLPDPVIEHCIDEETTSVLTPLRKQLGLSQHAFLIPADAHDFLIENGQLSQDQFHSVIGGNILDDSHLNALVSALEDIKDHKVAATLFFHEHVVAILKLKRTISSGSAVSWWYDVIDSLPSKATFCRTNETPVELCQRLGIFNGLTEAEMVEESELSSLPKTARIRCLDAEALIAFIRWYACSKFNDENMAYIDQYNWDDKASDFDPRVFQAFLWQGVKYKSRSNLFGRPSNNAHNNHTVARSGVHR